MRSPSASRYCTGNEPGACTNQARHRRASRTPGETSAPVGQAVMQQEQLPQPLPWASGVRPWSRAEPEPEPWAEPDPEPWAEPNGASVTTLPSTNHDPRPGSNSKEFLPNQPSPARCAAARSTNALSSLMMVARQPSAFSRSATGDSAWRNAA